MKILVLHCGGTISCESINGVLSPRANIEKYFDRAVNGACELEHKKIEPFLSELLNGKRLWSILCPVRDAVNSGRYDGIIVTHGSDTVAYTSAYLGYALGLCEAPVVTVSADKPLSDPLSSGHAAISSAISLILSKDARGVFSAWRDHVCRGTRILRHRTFENELPTVSEIYGKCRSIAPEIGNFEKNELYREHPDELKPMPAELKGLSPVTHLMMTPSASLPSSLPEDCRAVLLHSYHSGTLDTKNPSLPTYSASVIWSDKYTHQSLNVSFIALNQSLIPASPS